MAAIYPSPVFTQNAAHGVIPTAAPTIPAGTFAPGTKVQVGGHRVAIDKYLSEGGFAHVYLVRLPKPIEGDDTAVLKRVAVPDKEALASMRIEVETMKKLKGHRHIVTYIDSHASQLKGGGYEVFLLMEYCNGGGLIDFMNTRLQNRLTEPEILKIFADVAQGVACMHYLKPPLLHRDLKVENILIRNSGSTRRYKLCDFGSTAPPRPAATTAVEGRLIEDDVQKNTTLQYRSPEMVDVYRKQPIDEKSDIWALGVLLYKLCYYKTPFEEQGQMAILNATFKFPNYPPFSDRLKKLIASLLRENPQQRPNIYQTIKEVCLLRGTDIPIKDIYTGRTQSEARRNQHLPPAEPDVKTPPIIAGAVRAPIIKEEQVIPDITPMRRGRPNRAEPESRAAKPSPSPLRNRGDDPFAVLDARKVSKSETAAYEDASSRFPALDDFSLLHDSGGKFAFDPKSEPPEKARHNITQRVTNALADDAFAMPKSEKTATLQAKPTKEDAANDIRSSQPPLRRPQSSGKEQILSSLKITRPSMVSTGTMTSPSPPSPPSSKSRPVSSRTIFRFPPSSDGRSTSQPRSSDAAQVASDDAKADSAGPSRVGMIDSRSKSQTNTPQLSISAGPPFETDHRSSYLNGLDDSVSRSKSANSKSRPSSFQGPSKPGIFRRLSRERSAQARGDSTHRAEALISAPTGESDGGDEAVKIDSNVEYLKAMEEGENSKRKEKRHSSGSRHIKRASMPSVSLSGTKNLLAGRFGEAFRRFENTTSEDTATHDLEHSPAGGSNDLGSLSPIVGSEATDGRSDDGHVLEESEETPPEIRRELERRRLSQEERRVADAAAAYRQRLAEGDKTGMHPGPNKKAMSIQSKVKSLLDESGRASPSPTKTTEGYGRFTDQGSSPIPPYQPPPRTSSHQVPIGFSPKITQTAIGVESKDNPDPSLNKTTAPPQHEPQTNIPAAPRTASEPPRNAALAIDRQTNRPVGPPRPQPKPQALRTGDGRPQSPLKPPSLAGRKPLPNRNPYQTPPLGQIPPSTLGGLNIDSMPQGDDWESNFSKKYPDLSGLELVETEIDRERPQDSGRLNGTPLIGREMRVRDV